MITVNGRFLAALVLLLAGASLVAVGVVIAVSNRVTGHEVLAGLITLAVAMVAGLWLRRDKRNGGQQ